MFYESFIRLSKLKKCLGEKQMFFQQEHFPNQSFLDTVLIKILFYESFTRWASSSLAEQYQKCPGETQNIVFFNREDLEKYFSLQL